MWLPDMPAARAQLPAQPETIPARSHSWLCLALLPGPLQCLLTWAESSARSLRAAAAQDGAGTCRGAARLPRPGLTRAGGGGVHYGARHYRNSSQLQSPPGKYTPGPGRGRDERGADRTATRPRPGALQLTEGSTGLYSSNRPGGHESLRR